MNKQLGSRPLTAVTLVVAWGLIGLATNVAPIRLAPATVWLLAAIASIAVTLVMTWFRKVSR